MAFLLLGLPAGAAPASAPAATEPLQLGEDGSTVIDARSRLVWQRCVEGMRWAVAGPLVGTSQVRLVPSSGGVGVHYVLAAEPTEPGSRSTARRPTSSPRAQRELGSLRRRQAMAWKAAVWALKDELESGRS